ncbi:hypothetical protein HRbin36_01180 [bacterium HR36]|nr:hypothetical protein HRbin36_01180 [bacterium HR36]
MNYCASLLITPAIYILARRLLSPRIAFGVTLLFHTLPGLARCLSDALSEGLYLMGVAWSLAFTVHALQTGQRFYFFASGFACGLAYWARPEAAVLAGAVWLTLLLGSLRRSLILSAGWMLSSLVCFTLALGLTIAPYCYAIGGLTVKASGQHFLRIYNQLVTSSEPAETRCCLAATIVASHKASPCAKGLPTLLDEIAQGFFYAPLVLVIPGLFLASRKSCRCLAWWPVLMYMLLHFLVLWRGVHVLGYMVERYTYPITLCGLICGGLAWRIIAISSLKSSVFRDQDVDLIASSRLTTLMHLSLAAFLAVCVAKLTLQPLHYGAAGHKQAGYWLKNHLKPRDNLFDPYGLAAFYSGWTLLWAQNYPEGIGTPTGDWWFVLNRQEKDTRVRERILAFSAIAESANEVFASGRDLASQAVVYHLPGPVHKFSPLRGRYFPRVR